MKNDSWTQVLAHPKAYENNGYTEPHDYLRYRVEDDSSLTVQIGVTFHQEYNEDLNLNELTSIFNKAPKNLEDTHMSYYDTDTGYYRASFYGWRNTTAKKYVDIATRHYEGNRS